MSVSLELNASAIARPIRNRWLLLTALSVVGLLAYVPALATMGVTASSEFILMFAAIFGAVCGLAAWLGLRWADRANLPMPWLRALDDRVAPSRADHRGTMIAIAGGVTFALASIATLRAFDLENMPGSLTVRLLSTVFAAISMEVVLHLAIMSGLTAWTRSPWIGIAGSTLAFLLFHTAGAVNQAPEILGASILLNGTSGVFFGWLYARFGFEYLILGHAVAHALACGVG